jgi:hypothetical protein
LSRCFPWTSWRKCFSSSTTIINASTSADAKLWIVIACLLYIHFYATKQVQKIVVISLHIYNLSSASSKLSMIIALDLVRFRSRFTLETSLKSVLFKYCLHP